MLSILGVLRRPALPLDPTNQVLYGIGWDKGRRGVSELHSAGADQRSGRDPARAVTSNVVNNVYVLRIPPHTAAGSPVASSSGWLTAGW